MAIVSKAPTIEDANLRLREEAAPLGADAIVAVTYVRGIGLFAWKELRATGKAVVLKRAPSGDAVEDDSSGRMDIGDRLRRLQKLRSEGLIDDGEYQRKRREVLDGL